MKDGSSEGTPLGWGKRWLRGVHTGLLWASASWECYGGLEVARMHCVPILLGQEGSLSSHYDPGQGRGSEGVPLAQAALDTQPPEIQVDGLIHVRGSVSPAAVCSQHSGEPNGRQAPVRAWRDRLRPALVPIVGAAECRRGSGKASVPLSSDALCGTCDLGRGLWTGGSRLVDFGTMVTVASAAASICDSCEESRLLTAAACHLHAVTLRSRQVTPGAWA